MRAWVLASDESFFALHSALLPDFLSPLVSRSSARCAPPCEIRCFSFRPDVCRGGGGERGHRRTCASALTYLCPAETRILVPSLPRAAESFLLRGNLETVLYRHRDRDRAARSLVARQSEAKMRAILRERACWGHRAGCVYRDYRGESKFPCKDTSRDATVHHNTTRKIKFIHYLPRDLRVSRIFIQFRSEILIKTHFSSMCTTLCNR